MLNLVIQASGLLALLIGLLLGEVIALRAFGRPKPAMVFVDLILFVVAISVLYSSVGVTEFGPTLWAMNFVIGLALVPCIRGVERLLRLTEVPRAEEKIGVNVVRELSRAGLNEEEIKGVLRRSGLSPKTVDKLSGMIEANVPPYVPKLVKLEVEVSDIKAALEKLIAILEQREKPARKARKARGRPGKKK